MKTSARPARRLSLALGCTMVLLNACTTLGPDYQEPEVNWLKDWQPSLYGQADNREAQEAADLGFWWKLFDDPVLAAVMLLVTGTLVYTLKYTAPRATDDEPGPGQSMWIGIAQALAIVPGVSRSGATVAVGAWRGVEVIHVAEFSFLMSIPAILGAGLLRFGDFAGNGIYVGPLAAGFVAALVSGVLAIHLFIRMLGHATLYRFAYYCWFVGLTFLASVLFFPDLGG